MPANKDVAPVAVPLVGTEINEVIPKPNKFGMKKLTGAMPHIAAARMPAPEPELVDTLENTPSFNPTMPAPGQR